MATRYTPVTDYEEDIMGIFQASQILSVRQHVKLLPKNVACVLHA